MLDEFESRRVRIIAASIDPLETTKKLAADRGYTFTILCDTEAAVIRRLDLLHENGGMDAPDIARPAEFLIDPTGTVRWVNLTDNWRVRPRPEDLLRIVDNLQTKTETPESQPEPSE